MALTEYKAKRKFDRTPEPASQGRRARQQGPLHFVVQKHDASHLHYDFRLEMDGVLKSWAVPKGPSLNPSEKRLAVQVEDHPLDYRTFEGVIPEGNYGAGAVMVWDEGEVYVRRGASRAENERLLKNGLQKGKLKFTVKGRKLRGTFSLVRMQDGLRNPKGNSWLLIKADDAFASDADILKQERSALTDRTLDEIALGWAAEIQLDEALKAPMPRRIKPMLTTLVNASFDKPDWFFEIKWDGYRAIAEVQDGKVNLYSRNLLSFNEKFPVIVQALASFKGDLVLDGEIVALDDEGRPRFQLLQEYQENEERLVYYVFDLLYVNGYDIRKLPLRQRKELLKQVLPESDRIRYCDHVEAQGQAFFRAVTEQGLEGMIAKDASSIYLPGKRTSAWLKIKTRKRQEAIICGFTAPRGSRKDLGALILGVYEGTRLKYVGHTGTGMDTQTLRSLHQMLEPLTVKKSPFTPVPKTNEKATWVKPQLVCEVAFTEWTREAHMRHPVYLGLREDKKPGEVVMETEKPVTQAFGESEIKSSKKRTSVSKKSQTEQTQRGETVQVELSEDASGRATWKFRVNRHVVTITNPDKVLWPDAGYRKKDLVAYYRDIAEYILPYLKDRPLTLHRFPHGVSGEGFYQKDMDMALPEWVETLEVYSESNEGYIRYVLCQNAETLVWLANLGCIEMNPWNSRKQNLERPDWVVLDLDPQGIDFKKVIDAALVAHQILDDLQVPNYCKTSGKTGLHLYVPLGGKYDYDVARNFGELIADQVHRELPRTTSLLRSPSKRKNKIYLDYLQNRFGQTLVAPYSLRPTPEATVSTPLLWEEVRPGLAPTQFTLANALERIENLGDIWKPVLGAGVDLRKLVHSSGWES